MVFSNGDLSISNLQLATAYYHTALLSKHKRQLIDVGTGLGKSRILHAVAILALLAGKCEHVCLVYTNDHLRDRDCSDFESWFQILGIEEKISYDTGI